LVTLSLAEALTMRANKVLLLVASLVTLSLLGWAAAEENVFRGWRVEQRRYRAMLPAPARADFSVQLRQIVVPALRTTDRCVSCHAGMAPGEEAIPGDPVFGPHPPVVHDPAEYGCVVCHGGQGLATDKEDAHGSAPHWPEPMIPERYAYAGCGSCHTHLAVPNAVLLEKGRSLFERLDCLACHAVDGRGGTIRPGGAAAVAAPDLSRAGAAGYDQNWYGRHLGEREKDPAGAWRTSFGPIGAEDLEAIRVYLDSRVGAPGLIESKALFHSLGCRGCHKVGGVGGSDGPDLTQAGERDPGQTDFSAVPGEPTMANWFAEHLRAPAAVVPGSQMPAFGLPEESIERLTTFTFSLRRSAFPEAYWPIDRIRAERFREREFALDGATLFGTFCAACHGRSGEGMRYAGMPAFPAIGSPDFLSIASDSFLVETIRHGRPGRRMAAWGEAEGGLRPEEIEKIVRHIRAMGGVASAPDPLPRRWSSGDVAEGSRLYASACSGCHGTAGEGAEGPALANPVLLRAATDTYLTETITRGRRGTSMEGFALPTTTRPAFSREEIESIVTFLRTWETKP
jgi:cbb3-type cytochrome c oxidase subunit III